MHRWYEPPNMILWLRALLLSLAAELLENLVGTLSRDTDHGTHGVRQSYPRDAEIYRRRSGPFG
jgi:hypothetical protein